MADDVMGGVDATMAVLRAFLADRLPKVLTRLDDRYGPPVTPADLWRPPQTYSDTHDPLLQPGDYPAVLTLPQSIETVEVAEQVDGGTALIVPYRIRILELVRQPTADDAVRARNRLVTATVQALLERPSLRTDAEVDAGTPALRHWVPTGWRASFSDVGVDENDTDNYAGAFLDVTVNSYEAATPPPLGVVETVELEVDIIDDDD